MHDDKQNLYNESLQLHFAEAPIWIKDKPSNFSV